MLPRELWLLIHAQLEPPTFQSLALTCKWQFEEYKDLEEIFFKALEKFLETVPARHTLVNVPKTYDPDFITNWTGNSYLFPLTVREEAVKFTIHTDAPKKEDIASLSSPLNKKVHFNFQNRPKLRYVVDFEQWNVSAVELGDHARNTSRNSHHRLVLDHKTNQIDEISIEEGEHLSVVWKKPDPKDNLEIGTPIEAPLLDNFFSCWLSDRPKSAHDVFFYAQSEFFDNVLVYYVNWKALRLDLVSKGCHPFDAQPMAMKNSMYSGICNAHFLYFTQDAICVRNIVSGKLMIHLCQEPQLIHYDNRYFIFADNSGEYVVDVVRGEVSPLSPRQVLRAVPSIHMVSVTEEKGVECWVPGWASLGQLKAGESKAMTEGFYFGRVQDDEVVFGPDVYDDIIGGEEAD
ncbi:hypothetical protein CJU90_5924 [Yarrowia sp. C11]|nr:hypothetical protein CJU90_5924 [Yarrowia sp. C11]KAG5370645.1 hypothetical protein CKK34_0766 [Yarrowia sp. E02]